MNANAVKIFKAAKSWVGREFNPGVPAQCAAFVRAVYKQAGVDVNVAVDPTGPPDSTGPYLADSFSTSKVGLLVSLNDSLPGDIIMYANTYGDYALGTITHVGIISAPGGEFQIDRSTSAHPVYERSPHTFSSIAEIRRPYSLVDTAKKCKVFLHPADFNVVTVVFSDGTEQIVRMALGGKG